MRLRPRRTKIIATLGPATDSPEVMQALLKAGVNIVRVNFSHAGGVVQTNRIALARKSAQVVNKVVGILVDLQGPKIRIAQFRDQGGVVLKEGALFCLDAAWDKSAGDETVVGLDYPALPQEVTPGDQLLLDDGRLVLVVKQVIEQRVICEVSVGGRLSSHKGLNRKGGGLCAPSLTEKDKKDIALIADLAIDYVALSFPRDANDIRTAKALLNAVGSQAKIVAKIERAEAIDNLDEILAVADAVMVARGDLGVEIGYAQLPGMQKQIISQARACDKAVITATQMMESMISNPIPTRAEVSDVANAVLDGTDAVMLSAETATGAFPVKVVASLDEICAAAERHPTRFVGRREALHFGRHDKAMAMAAMYLANHVPIKAIVVLTESGSTPLWMSRVSSGIPIYALSRHAKTRGRVTLFRGVYPVAFDVTLHKPWQISQAALATLVLQKILAPGDKVIVIKGDVLGIGGHTNALKILTVPETQPNEE